MDLPKKYLNKRFIAAALLIMFAFIYIIHHIGKAFEENTELFTVTPTTLESTVDLSGYIFRDETVIAGAGEYCSYSYRDGEKVPAGSKVAYYIAAGELREKYEALRSRIDVLEDSASLLHIDLAEVDGQIAALRTEIAVKSALGDLSTIDEYERELLLLLHKRALAENNKSDFSAELTVLRAEMAALQASVSAMGGITAEESGYFYSYADGYESVCTVDAAKNMSFEAFEEIEALSPGGGGAAGKIAAVGKWYYVCKMSIEAAEEIVSDERYDCVFTDNSYRGSVPVFVEQKLVDYTKGEVLLVFSCAHIPEGFDFSRMQRAKLAVAEVSGLRVPSSAVRVLENGQTIVYIIKEGICRPRNISILFEKSGYCVVAEAKTKSDLDLYDRIITGDINLYDGKVIDY